MNILLRMFPAKKTWLNLPVRAKATFANPDSIEDASLGLAELAFELERLVSKFRYTSESGELEQR